MALNYERDLAIDILHGWRLELCDNEMGSGVYFVEMKIGAGALFGPICMKEMDLEGVQKLVLKS